MQHHDTQVVVGVITSAHGVRGEVKIKSFTEIPEDLLSYGTLTDAAGEVWSIKIKGQAKGQLIAYIKGVDNRNKAEALKGKELLIHRDQMPQHPEEEGSFFITDLTGLPVTLEDGSPYGTIKSIQNYGAGDIVEITLPNQKKTELLPFSEACFPIIDMENKKIVCHPPEIIKGGADSADNEQHV